jgi:uncharacterized protein YcnI
MPVPPPGGIPVLIVPSTTPKGSHATLDFAVPNPHETLDMIAVEITLPADQPILSALLRPMPGWSVTLQKKELATPIEGAENVTEAISKVTWTATTGGLSPGQFDLFEVNVGPLPTDSDSMAFTVHATLTSGEVVPWDEEATEDMPSPAHPAPVLTLTKASTDTNTMAPHDAGGGEASTTTAGGADEDADDDGTDGLAVAALIVGIIAVLLASGAFLTTRRRHS